MLFQFTFSIHARVHSCCLRKPHGTETWAQCVLPLFVGCFPLSPPSFHVGNVAETRTVERSRSKGPDTCVQAFPYIQATWPGPPWFTLGHRRPWSIGMGKVTRDGGMGCLNLSLPFVPDSIKGMPILPAEYLSNNTRARRSLSGR